MSTREYKRIRSPDEEVKKDVEKAPLSKEEKYKLSFDNWSRARQERILKNKEKQEAQKKKGKII